MSTPEKPTADSVKGATPASGKQVQGEGDYESARRFDADERRFVDSADIPELARRAAPRSKEEAAKLKEAEDIGRSHAAGGKQAAAKPQQTESSPKSSR